MEKKIVVLTSAQDELAFANLCNNHAQEIRREEIRSREDRETALETQLRYALAFASGMAFAALLFALMI